MSATRRAEREPVMPFLNLYRYYRFLGMSMFDAARFAYQLRRR
jgi:hypothetical protein